MVVLAIAATARAGSLTLRSSVSASLWISALSISGRSGSTAAFQVGSALAVSAASVSASGDPEAQSMMAGTRSSATPAAASSDCASAASSPPTSSRTVMASQPPVNQAGSGTSRPAISTSVWSGSAGSSSLRRYPSSAIISS